MKKCKIVVKRVAVNRKQEYAKRERWEGSGTWQVMGLGHNKPGVLERYECVYPREMQTVYGTVDEIKYGRKLDGSYERIIVTIWQVGVADIAKENDKLTTGPDWAIPDLPIALINIQVSVRKNDWKQILPQLSSDAAGFLQKLLATKNKPAAVR